MSLRMSRTDHIDLGDFIVLWKGGNDDYRAIAYDDMLKKLKEDLRQSPTSNQYVSALTDTTVDLSTESVNSWVKVISSSEGVNLNINMPMPSFAVDGQELLLTNQSDLVMLNLNLFGASIVGQDQLTILTTGNTFSIKYDKTLNTWYRVI